MAERSAEQGLRFAAVVILGVGAALQFILWSRQWLAEDQIILLSLGLEFAEGGGLASFGKGMSGGGNIPGALLQLLIGISLRLWPDFRSPALLIGITHLVAVAVLGVTLAKSLGMRTTVFFLAIYWLSPWRLYHAGFLWEPGFVFLPAAVHLASSYRLRDRPRFLASAALVAAIVMTMQIHASFLVLIVSTAILLWKKKVRLNLKGALLGLIAGSLTLIPTAVSFVRGDLPRLAPARWEYLPPVVQEISNVFKGLLYWFRLGSLDIGRRIRHVAGTVEAELGDSALGSILAAGVGVLAAVAMASIVISVVASWGYFRRSSEDEGPSDGRPSWIRFYALSFLLSVGIASLLAPVPVQGWHVVIALHAACIPVAFWLERNLLGQRAWLRTAAASFIVLQVVITLAIGFGNPTYVRASEPLEAEEAIPEELQRLFR
jgi:hypothetical protein